jgi:hypothetical protein
MAQGTWKAARDMGRSVARQRNAHAVFVAPRFATLRA